MSLVPVVVRYPSSRQVQRRRFEPFFSFHSFGSFIQVATYFFFLSPFRHINSQSYHNHQPTLVTPLTIQNGSRPPHLPPSHPLPLRLPPSSLVHPPLRHNLHLPPPPNLLPPRRHIRHNRRPGHISVDIFPHLRDRQHRLRPCPSRVTVG